MLDIKFIRDNTEKVKKGVTDKQLDPAIVDKVLELDKERRELILRTEALRKRRNEIADKLKMGKGKPDQALIDEGKKVKEELKAEEPKLSEIEEEYLETLKKVPNIPAEDVPYGKDESENIVARSWGEPKKYDFTPKDHIELGEELGIIDTKKASEITGPRFGYLMGDAALLEFSLIQFALSVLTNENTLKDVAAKHNLDVKVSPFIPIVPPVMIKPEVFDRMARLYPKEERYYIPTDDAFLIGSAEHTLGPLHMDETLKEEELPKRYIGFSTAFRREAGASGKDTRGIIRVHQFDKLEMESFTLPEDSVKEQNFIVALQEYFMQSLNLPYQVIAISTGDMGKPDYRQFDINTWMPGQNQYRETHTSDLMTDYQARRLNTKFRKNNGEIGYVHMNDATAFAIGRTIVAILENNQEKDGSVIIPEVLRKWIGKEKIEKCQ